MTKPWLGHFILVGLGFMLAAPTWADYQAGVDAYERGDYETALKEWRPLANQGLAVAQNNLWWMYDQGEGVAQDYTEAMKWYRLAADQGLAAAQNNLGAMYINGEGVRRNYVQGYMWLSLAAKQGYKRAVLPQGQLEREMTPDELAEAQRLARAWERKGSNQGVLLLLFCSPKKTVYFSYSLSSTNFFGFQGIKLRNPLGA